MLNLVIDTNVALDALARRTPFDEAARLLLGLGEVGEFTLWVSTSQMTDIFYVLSNGGRASEKAFAKRKLAGFRAGVHLQALSSLNVDQAISSRWDDFEDACVYQVARDVKPDAIITRNAKDFALSDIPIYTCEEFFDWLREEKGIDYAEIAQS